MGLVLFRFLWCIVLFKIWRVKLLLIIINANYSLLTLIDRNFVFWKIKVQNTPWIDLLYLLKLCSCWLTWLIFLNVKCWGWVRQIVWEPSLLFNWWQWRVIVIIFEKFLDTNYSLTVGSLGLACRCQYVWTWLLVVVVLHLILFVQIMQMLAECLQRLSFLWDCSLRDRSFLSFTYP